MGIRVAQSPVTPYLGDFDVLLNDMPNVLGTGSDSKICHNFMLAD